MLGFTITLTEQIVRKTKILVKLIHNGKLNKIYLLKRVHFYENLKLVSLCNYYKTHIHLLEDWNVFTYSNSFG